MKPSTMSFRGEDRTPAWLATLVRELADGGGQAPPELLSPVTALEELRSVTAAMLAGRRAPYPADRKSLRTDILSSFDCPGPASKALHATAVADFRKQGARLDKLLDDVGGAHVLHAGAEVLLAELTSVASVRAAFDDTVTAFDSDAFVGVCESRLLYLRTVVEATGHDWSERVRQVHDALADRDSALLAAGALDPPHAGEPIFFEEAGLDVDERLCLAKVILTAEPPSGPVAVWLAYANAFLSDFYLSLGPLEFYDSRVWDAALKGQWPGNPTWTQPPELADEGAKLFVRGLPSENFVVVRVSVDGALATARARARGLARAAVELTGWDSDWVLMDGECGYTSDWFGTMGFSDPRERALHASGSPLTDPVAHVLADVDADLLNRLAAGESRAAEFLADTRWRRTIATVPDAEHRIALLVALFERALAPSAVGSDKWYGACKRYFEMLMSFDDVHQQVWDAGHYGLHALNHTPAGAKHFRAFDTALVNHTGPDSFNVRLKEVVGAAASLRQHLDAASMEARMLAEIEQKMSSGTAAAAWLSESRTRFDRLLPRARRQRNAITHGTRTVPAVLATVEPFLDRIAGRLIGAIHYCVAEQRDVTFELEGWRLHRLKTRDQLAAGAPADLLFD